MRKVVISLLVLFGSLALLGGTAFVFREDLVRYAAGRFLAGGQLTLTRLQGLDVTPAQLTVAELEFLLDASGQRLVISGLDVDYRFVSLSAAPVVDSIAIASAQLFAGTASADAPDEAVAAASGETTQLSGILALLREFPLDRITVGSLALPGRSEALRFELQRDEGGLQAQAASGALSLQARFAQADASADAQLDLVLTSDNATPGEFRVTLQPRGEAYALAGSGKLDIPDVNALLGELEQSPLAVPLRAARLEWTLAGSVADDLRGALRASGPQTFTLGIQPESTVTLPAELAAGLDTVTLAFTDGAEFVVTSGAGFSVSSTRVPLHVASAWKGQAAVADAVLSLDACELAAAAGCTLGFDGTASLGAHSIAGVIRVNAAGGNYRVETHGLGVTGLPAFVPAFDIAAAIGLDARRVSFSTPLVLRDGPVDAGIMIEGTFDLEAGALQMHAAIPELEFTEGSGALSSWFGAWPYTFDVLAGSFAAQADLAWQAGVLTGTVNGNLQDLGGFYGDYFFGGVSGALQAAIDTAGKVPVSTPPQTLHVASIDIGLPLEDVAVSFSVEPTGVLHIDSVLAHALDGTISGAGITYDPARERNDLLVKFDGLRMERMLDLVDYEGIEAIGAVSGEVPLTIAPGGVEVAAGVLAADAPGGSIRYLAAAAGATGNAGLDLVNQALGNYQFDSLTSDIEYTPDGELVLAMKLQGRNPDMSGGQRINVNLNLSDNIPALLESLQAARAIEDFLAEQYQ
jgi:hypothetical protein